MKHKLHVASGQTPPPRQGKFLGVHLQSLDASLIHGGCHIGICLGY
jgi:hypothetical protein